MAAEKSGPATAPEGERGEAPMGRRGEAPMSGRDEASPESKRGEASPESERGEEAPPPGVRTMAAVRWAILAGVAVVALLSFWFLLAPEGAANVKYICPMAEHAFVVKDDPGECPVCHMTLVPMPAEAAEARKKGAAAVASELPPDTPPGLVPIHVELGRAQKIGVRTAIVEEADAGSGLRAPAYVSAPEAGASQVHVRAPGFVERVVVGQTGVAVGSGQPLVYVYSPDIYRAEEEMLAVKRFEGAGGGLASGPTLEAARRRLELFGMTSQDIDEILRKGAPERAVAVRAPASGHVTRKEIALGAYVTPEMVLYEIADLSRVYVVADVFTRDAGVLKVGSVGLLRFASMPGPEIRAKVDLIYPEMNAAARTTRVRLQVPNPGMALRPGLYGEVRFETGARRALVVPRDAVVDTGESRYVFVDLGEGRYAPRLVALGAEQGERVEIVSGLRAGERVVSGATFLLDSESRLQAALTGVAAPHASASPPSAGAHSSHAPPSAGAHSSHAPPSAGAHSSHAPMPPPSPLAPVPAPASAGAAAPAGAPASAEYWCPMHPEVQSPVPGRCPKCGMALEAKKAGAR